MQGYISKHLIGIGHAIGSWYWVVVKLSDNACEWLSCVGAGHEFKSYCWHVTSTFKSNSWCFMYILTANRWHTWRGGES